MLVLLVATALAASPCVATATGPGWRVSLIADLANGALLHAKQEISVDVPAIDQGDSPYEYNSDLNKPNAPMARVILTELTTPGRPSAGTVELLAPEVYAPVEVMMAGLTGGEAPPPKTALRVLAGGAPIAWRVTGMYPSPADLPGSNIHVYSGIFGDLSEPPDPAYMEPATRILGALQTVGTIKVETVVGKPLDAGGRAPVPDKDDPASTEVAGSFELSAAALGPALAGLAGAQAKVGQDYGQGKCGVPAPSASSGKK